MFRTPFFLRRPWLLLRDSFINRNHPNLGELRHIQDAEKFVWNILPHAARTFSACIAMLPERQARSSAVAYLYSRILDTYEDLHPELEQRIAILEEFSVRFDDSHSNEDGQQSLKPAPPIPKGTLHSRRDLAHLLLVDRCDKVDTVYFTLPSTEQKRIRELIRAMAKGMAESARLFHQQGGVLVNQQQVLDYSDHVLGNPVRFAISTVQGSDPTGTQLDDARAVGEMVQLANITRDIEHDLLDGKAYHPALRPWLGVKVLVARDDGGDSEDQYQARTAIRAARSELMDLALERAAAYRRMVCSIKFKRFSLARAAAVLMMIFTDRYYRSCARRCGRESWPGYKGPIAILLTTLPCIFMVARSERMLRQLESNLLQAVKVGQV